MVQNKRRLVVAALALLMAVATAVSATTVLQMSLGEMCGRADRIFRGTVVGMDAGSLVAGGSELPTVTYKIRVAETFKGEVDSVKGVDVVEITMLGRFKDQVQGTVRNHFQIANLPQLEVGQEYLLLTTPPSALGLSTTVGLGQGAFHIDKSGMVVNGFSNAGLFAGPVAYGQIASQLRAELGQ